MCACVWACANTHIHAQSGKNGKNSRGRSLLSDVYRENSLRAEPAFQAKINSTLLQITRQETRCCSPLPLLLSCSPVNILLICCVVRSRGKTHKPDSFSNSLMTRVYLAEWSAFHSARLVASCGVCVNTKPCKDYWVEELLSIEFLMISILAVVDPCEPTVWGLFSCFLDNTTASFIKKK